MLLGFLLLLLNENKKSFDDEQNRKRSTNTCLSAAVPPKNKTKNPFQSLPFTLRSVVLKAERLESLLRPTPAEDVKQIGFTRLHSPASQLKVLIPKRHGLCLLPLVVEHIDCDLRQGDQIV